MFGFQKNKQPKSVEEFLRGQAGATVLAESARMEEPPGNLAGDRAGAPVARGWLAAAVVVAGSLLVLSFAAFAKIDRLGHNVADVRSHLDTKAVEELNAQVTAVDGRLRKSAGETDQLKARIARLERDLDAMRLASARRAEAEAKAQAQAKKKAPVKKKAKARHR